eukprot:14257087-Ditylum_brightwellii.AAC.1
MAHGANESKCTQLKIAWFKSTIKTMFQFKDHLTTLDQQYMCQSHQEVEEFIQTRSVAYIKDWIAIWYPFYK